MLPLTFKHVMYVYIKFDATLARYYRNQPVFVSLKSPLTTIHSAMFATVRVLAAVASIVHTYMYMYCIKLCPRAADRFALKPDTTGNYQQTNSELSVPDIVRKCTSTSVH